MYQIINLVIVLSLLISACENVPAGEASGPEASATAQTLSADDMRRLGTAYAAAWSSGQPQKVADFFAPDGSLTLNQDPPTIGTEAIMQSAQRTMTSFPDLKLHMDSLVQDTTGYVFHWRMSGTNTGPDGTGYGMFIPAVERWTMTADGRIQVSKVTLDMAEYEQQVIFGVYRQKK